MSIPAARLWAAFHRTGAASRSLLVRLEGLPLAKLETEAHVMVSRDAAPDVCGRLRGVAVGRCTVGSRHLSQYSLRITPICISISPSSQRSVATRSSAAPPSADGRASRPPTAAATTSGTSVALVRLGRRAAPACSGLVRQPSRSPVRGTEPAWRGHRTDSAQTMSIESVMSDSKGPGVDRAPACPNRLAAGVFSPNPPRVGRASHYAMLTAAVPPRSPTPVSHRSNPEGGCNPLSRPQRSAS